MSAPQMVLDHPETLVGSPVISPAQRSLLVVALDLRIDMMEMCGLPDEPSMVAARHVRSVLIQTIGWPITSIELPDATLLQVWEMREALEGLIGHARMSYCEITQVHDLYSSIAGCLLVAGMDDIDLN